MRNTEQWVASKFQPYRGAWRASRDGAAVGVSSRLYVELLAGPYSPRSQLMCEVGLSTWAAVMCLSTGCTGTLYRT